MPSVARKSPPERQTVSIAWKKIRSRKQDLEAAALIAREYNLDEIPARVLAARGFKVGEELKNYISPTLKEGLPDPWKLKNLQAACRLIADHVAAGKGIAICSDFDVDGLSGGAQVYHFLKTVGARVEAFVPDRFADGYGLNERIVRDIREKGLSLLVAIDYGTTNLKELAVAREIGLSSVVLDHHHVGDTKNPADVFVNPNQDGCGFADKVMCAAGLAWYMLLGLKRMIPAAASIDVRSYLDLACLGTICDMVPLIGVNRIIAKRGLEQLTTSKRPGLAALKNVIGSRGAVNCHDVGFGIGPRLNAAGRMVHGEVVIDLLTTSDTETAERLASRLNRLNLERQDAESVVKEKAIAIIEQRGYLEPGIVVSDPEFHTGVIGIVAQRLVETFYRPAVVMGVDSEGIYKGSVRGIKGFSVVEALGAVGEHLLKFGGHEGAGGLSLHPDNLEAFSDAWIKECSKRLQDTDLHPYTEADAEVKLDELDLDVVKGLNTFSPFGMGNPTPVLFTRKLKVHEIKILKKCPPQGNVY